MGAKQKPASGDEDGANARTVAPRPGRADETAEPKGTLIIIGGHEDKRRERLILRAVASRVRGGRLVVATVASSSAAGELWEEYDRIFRELGVSDVVHLDVESRAEAKSEEKLRLLDGATGVFFTGGDQLKITSQLGDSPIYERIRQIYIDGGTVAGTSAGASVMTETMMVSGRSDGSSTIGGDLRMAPGFGLLPGVIVDQHFAERGRVGRLIAAVSQNPRILGIGIDEDTAIVCDPSSCFRVIGAGAVYVVDGTDVTYTNLTEEESDRTLSVFGVRMHLLSMGDEFDLTDRRPSNAPAEEIEAEILAGGGERR